MTSVKATRSPMTSFPNKGKESAENLKVKCGRLPSRRRVGTSRFLEPLDHLRRRYHTFRQMRIERARADVSGLG
jgi:hypothetical protein